MAKKFNITGNCIARLHYMANVSTKLNKIKDMVEEGWIDHNGKRIFIAWV
jgi:hypothetical protein